MAMGCFSDVMGSGRKKDFAAPNVNFFVDKMETRSGKIKVALSGGTWVNYSYA